MRSLGMEIGTSEVERIWTEFEGDRRSLHNVKLVLSGDKREQRHATSRLFINSNAPPSIANTYVSAIWITSSACSFTTPCGATPSGSLAIGEFRRR